MLFGNAEHLRDIYRIAIHQALLRAPFDSRPSPVTVAIARIALGMFEHDLGSFHTAFLPMPGLRRLVQKLLLQ